ncbi:hypothetical protein RhiTH_011125 [Rhizoctonia solani]
MVDPASKVTKHTKTAGLYPRLAQAIELVDRVYQRQEETQCRLAKRGWTNEDISRLWTNAQLKSIWEEWVHWPKPPTNKDWEDIQLRLRLLLEGCSEWAHAKAREIGLSGKLMGCINNLKEHIACIEEPGLLQTIAHIKHHKSFAKRLNNIYKADLQEQKNLISNLKAHNRNLAITIEEQERLIKEKDRLLVEKELELDNFHCSIQDITQDGKGRIYYYKDYEFFAVSHDNAWKVFRSEAVPLLEDIDVFWAEFTKHYVDTNRDEKYCQKWNNLQQKASVQEYTQEFQQYSVSLGYSNETLRNKYYNGLKNEIKDIMLSTMFQWRRATAQQVYDKAEEIANHIESTRLSNPSASTICATPTVSTSNPNSPPTRTRLNVRDNVYMIDPTTCRAMKGAITSVVCTTSGNMPNVRWNGETKDTMVPFPSLKKDERPAAAAPIKPIIAPTPVLASNSKGPGPMDLD